MTRRHIALALLVAAAVVIGTTPSWAKGPTKVGDVRNYHAETPHPYPLGTEARPVVWSDRVISPGAAFIRLHFAGLDLPPGDYVTVSSPDGTQIWRYEGRGPHGNGQVWAFAIDGDEAIVDLHGGTAPGHGYRIDAVGHGNVAVHKKRPQPGVELVCGTDGREDVACHLPEIDAAQRPVARLLFVRDLDLLVCTGWLVAGSNDSTLITNNHCIDSQASTDTLQATFGYQRDTCDGVIDAGISYAGGTLLKTNRMDRRGKKEGLDYTLLTLQGGPEAAWGELTATTKPVAINDLIWFVQHPAGNEKKVGYWEDAAHTVRCALDTVEVTYGLAAKGSQIGYACDSEGGSSGSTIVDPVTGRAIGLHHFSVSSSDPCLNAATMMSKICEDASSLLVCAED